ncbi:vWA domain-containing protein [Desulforamulus aquiferis]|uniref:VWA domain-containing protein n=1 Tax=Desulforamulus aquiferis TaxID=1397668 RepID=A0AAW7ZEK8_9FIRM|nr:vWA domain-containing protein [Desulforamulus aquiferis]MDO7787863.1 VWA domain-containing protein [Desulforamulus aquiferis]
MSAETLYVVLDISGSMREMGKLTTARSLITFIREYASQKKYAPVFCRVQIFTWNEHVHAVELSDFNETPYFWASGKTDMDQLRKWLNHHSLDSSPLNVIILSDGNYPESSLTTISRWLNQQSNINISVVSIGSDASVANLNKLSTQKKSFPPENISIALQTLFSQINLKTLPPLSLHD